MATGEDAQGPREQMSADREPSVRVEMGRMSPSLPEFPSGDRPYRGAHRGVIGAFGHSNLG